MNKDSYSVRLDRFLKNISTQTELPLWQQELIFESISDESIFGDTNDVLSWYKACIKNNSMTSTLIKLEDCEGWDFCKKSGSFVHNSGEFFRVDGIRVSGTESREVISGWDQPFLTQVGYDGGILGLLRKRFNGIPHYLVEAKAEPGNYNVIQITTTIQATFSNLKRAHKGNFTPYHELFLNPDDHDCKVLFDNWMSEDGGRLFNKRNRIMLIEMDPMKELVLVNEGFKWVSLFQLRRLICEEDAIVAPHIRGILSIV